ncbi:MAG TPA: hypothetical protein VE978_05525 [Chitinophagales bacterium]|nr:hypothetical protein [Chitinophagales bacterium]
MKFKKLNLGWNVEPNAPNLNLTIQGDTLRLEFLLNYMKFPHILEGEKGELIFKKCYKYNYNFCNDEGYYRGQYRYNYKELPWGEFYELHTDWENDFPTDSKIIREHLGKENFKHFIFFFRDSTFECLAEEYEFRRHL